MIKYEKIHERKLINFIDVMEMQLTSQDDFIMQGGEISEMRVIFNIENALYRQCKS